MALLNEKHQKIRACLKHNACASDLLEHVQECERTKKRIATHEDDDDEAVRQLWMRVTLSCHK
jgi:hypothetical protein